MSERSIFTNVPDNTNTLQTTKFTFTIPKLKFATYFCQTVMFPSVSTSEVLVPTPFSDTYRHGDKLVYEPLTITALVDEDLRIWEETYKWLAYLTNPVKFREYEDLYKDKYYDGILTINTNSHLPNIQMKYLYCHPITISGISFSTMDNPSIVPTFDLTFKFDRMEMIRL